MAIEHMSQAYKTPLAYHLKFILVTLSNRVDSSNYFSFVPSETAQRLGMPLDIFIQGLKELRDLGYLGEGNLTEKIEDYWENFDDIQFLNWTLKDKENVE